MTDDDPLAKWVTEARPELDPLARSVGYARVAAALFGEAPPVTVGRYRLERQLGRGGSGFVFVAHDPELHRDVAVKLIRATSDRHRERALAEARALAKLSHPNVVPVHDVGATAEHVYLVMELLRGQTLRAFAADPERTVREVVTAYRQVASGLAAAHAAGLVHRDVKPDNAMLGEDGRPRVVDFGLAAEDLAGGTPKYMSPEQRAGGTVTAATDQFALAVSLSEALADAPPAWLARVIARATADDPAARYPSMHALERALADDPRTRWTKRGLVAAPIVLAIAGFAIGQRVTSPTDDSCAGGPDLLASAWTPARGADVAQRIAQLGTPYALSAAADVRTRTQTLGAAWLDAHHTACTAHRRGELTDELYDRATVCLARSRVGFGEAMQVLARVQPTELATAIEALAAVERPERCADALALAAEAAPQSAPVARAIAEQIDRAAVHARAATAQAVPLAREAVTAARTSKDDRLIARALLVLGHAYMANDYDAAIAPLHEAMLTAVASGQDDIAAEAYARHAFVVARAERQPNIAGAFDGLELATQIGRRAGERGAFARALLANNLGATRLLAGDFVGARAGFERSLTEGRDVRGPDSVELTIAFENLGLVTPEASERGRAFADGLARITAAVGADHPRALELQTLAVVDGVDPAASLSQLEPLCARIAHLHPHLGALGARCAFELAWQALALGRTDVARAASQLAFTDVMPFEQHMLPVYAALADRRVTFELRAELERFARAEAEKLPLSWSQYIYVADVELARAAAGVPGRAAIAREYLEHVAAVTGVRSGLIRRRLEWANRL
jgi:predicted Ser/Thr protein kinase